MGKTTLLNQIRAHITDEFGWVAIRWTASPQAVLAQTIDDAYDDALKALRGRRGGRIGSVGMSAGVVRADVKLATGERRPVSVTAQLRRLSEAAANVNRHVVLLVDELQAGNATSIQELSTALQETNGDQLPVGLVAAGLPTTTARLRAIVGVTFLERQRITRLGNLEPGDARDAIERPLIDRGRRYDPEILPILVDAADGYPYALQLVAERTWDAAEDADEISIDHARRGVSIARGELDALYEGRWAQLAPAQQHYLIAVVSQLQPDGRAASDDVAAALGRTTKQLSSTQAHRGVSTAPF